MTYMVMYKIGEFRLGFIGGVNMLTGVLVPPETADLDSPEFLKALKRALEVHPIIETTSAFEEEAYTYCRYEDEYGLKRHLRGMPDDYLDKMLADADIAINQTVMEIADYVHEFAMCLQVEKSERNQIKEKRESRKETNGQRRTKTAPGYVYLLQSPTGAYKIGRSAKPNDRLQTFKVALPFEVDYLCTIATEDMYGLESRLHSLYAHKRVNGEWFNLEADDIAYIKSLAGGIS